MNDSEKPRINLLWTGGLDSTFRLCELSRENVEIQCYYILDPTRGSLKQEQKAMDRILKLLRNHPETKAIIHEIKKIDFNTILPDPKIQQSYAFFVEWNKLGSQYDYLARFAKQNNLRLEVGLEGSSRSKASNVLINFGALQKLSYTAKPSKWSEYYYINKAKASAECIDIFENIAMPAHLFGSEKTEEVDKMKAWGGGIQENCQNNMVLSQARFRLNMRSM